MNKKNTIPILFHGGSYGTYLEWCLTALTTDLSTDSPFTDKGNSHKFVGNHLRTMNGWRQYFDSPTCHTFVRLHPRTTFEDYLKQNLNEISSQVNFFIYLYPSDKTLWFSMMNQFTKVWEDWWNYKFNKSKFIDPSEIYKNWPVSRDVPINQIPNWIKREFLSYYLVPSYLDQIGWDQPDHYNQDNCLVVTIDDLFYNFENVIFKILTRSGLPITKSVDSLVPFHNRMIELQKNTDQIVLYEKIINSIVDQTLFDWSDKSLTLVNESFIQWKLRNLGWDIRCHGLDNFPTNSLQLKELLYPV
jgi:hypothetical protein